MGFNISIAVYAHSLVNAEGGSIIWLYSHYMFVSNKLEKEGTEIIVSRGPKNVEAKEIHDFSFYGNDTQDAFHVRILNRNTE